MCGEPVSVPSQPRCPFCGYDARFGLAPVIQPPPPGAIAQLRQRAGAAFVLAGVAACCAVVGLVALPGVIYVSGSLIAVAFIIGRDGARSLQSARQLSRRERLAEQKRLSISANAGSPMAIPGRWNT